MSLKQLSCNIANTTNTNMNINAKSLITTNTANTSLSINQLNEFEFIPPPEAPVFYPTAEEFALGPLEYISKIRPQAEPHGICKIIPPNSFQPPFAVAVEEFRFTPRIQRLNELEATTRIKLNFIEQIVKFWDLQGASFKIPNLERRSLDLYNLHRIVKEEGGFEICTKDRKWSRVASRLGYGNNTPNKGTIASLLRQHYERILFPYDVFQSGATIGPDIYEKAVPLSSDDDNEDNKDIKDKDPTDKLLKSPNDKQDMPEKRVLRRQQSMSPPQRNPIVFSPNSQNKELKKLQVYGAGPKMPGVVSEQPLAEKEQPNKVCLHCGESNPTPMLLTCDNCENTYHTHCLIPPLNDWPKGVWHCHRCLAQLVQSHPQPYTQEFGFAQSQKNYTLSEFGEMADQFKADYFNCPPHSVSLSLVEKEFWRLVSALEESVSVEYGADLHTNDYGSGFPTKLTKNLLPSDMEYINSSWNLNNLPILEGSVFRHINANISGMIIPWMYVGMCFATFCWHNEDHWTYSINYLHWGEPKTWYGVPGEHAETFERAMKRAAPELFKSQPDLLHQLVTICNPNILMQDGVPVYRTNQHAGEFVVTFPRAYHTGFNQGLNFAEAVNFAPSDWLPIGRVCITHYAMLHRYPVFSHDELICKMANDPNHLEITLAVATYRDMLRMVESEKTSRLALLEWGVTQAEREAFELLQDDERQCDYCKTTCFLSALTCSCDQAKLVCINHKDHLCKTCMPSQHTLRYRYTLDELPIMLHHLRKRAEKFDDWASKVQTLLKVDTNTNESDEQMIPTLKELKSLLNDAVVNRYPTNSDIYEQLQSIVSEASKCSRAARDLLKQQEILRKQQLQNNGSQQPQSPTKRTLRSTAGRNANSGLKFENVNTKLTLEEISLFYEEIAELQCEIPEKYQLKELIDKCNFIASSIMKVMDSSNSDSNVQSLRASDLEEVLIDAQSIAVVDFGPQLDSFRHKHEEVHWLEECDKVINFDEDIKVHEQRSLELSNIKTLIDNGMKLAANTDTINSKLADLQQMLDEANKWTEKAKSCLLIKTEGETEQEVNARKPALEFLESVLMEADNSPNLRRLQLSPQIDRIRENVEKSRNWITRVNAIFGSDNQKHSQKATVSNANVGEAPMIEVVEELVLSAAGIECQLEHLANLNSTISAARNWKDRLNRTFCKKNSIYSLIQVITPRIQIHYNHSDNSYSTRAFYQHLKRFSSNANLKDRKNSCAPSSSAQTVKLHKSIFETQLNGNYSRTCIVALYKMFEEQEINSFKDIRAKNSIKRKYLESKAYDFVNESKEDSDEVKQSMRFCICGKDADEWMIECQLCFDWFHNTCVQNYSSTNLRKKPQTQQLSPSEVLLPQQNFICILCSRGRRPKIDNILTLLTSLQKLPIRILEGELLQCVAERAITWQDRVKAALGSHIDLANGSARVKNQPSYQVTQMQPLNSSPTAISESRQTIANSAVNSSFESKSADEMATEEATAEALLQLQRSHPSISQVNSDTLESNTLELHSRNSDTLVSNESNTNIELSPLKHKRKSPLILRVETAAQPLVELSPESGQLLADLLLEANCLEVTLDEASHLWAVWLLSHPGVRTVLRYNKMEDNDLNDNKRKMSADLTETELQTKKKKSINLKDNKNVRKGGTKVKKTGKKSKSDDTDELCSMNDKCLKPNVAEVNWVQCDGPCSGWYHQLCIGIESPDAIASVEQFFCINCRKSD